MKDLFGFYFASFSVATKGTFSLVGWLLAIQCFSVTNIYLFIYMAFYIVLCQIICLFLASFSFIRDRQDLNHGGYWHQRQ